MDIEKMGRLVQSYKRKFGDEEGQMILKDLRNFSLIDEQAGSALTLSECAYRNALQDFYRYIEALATSE